MLSKTSVMTGLQCEKALWLATNRPDLIPPGDEERQKLLDLGRRVGALARTRFPGGVLIEGGDLKAAIARTRAAVPSAPTVFEATFAAGGCLVRVDILRRAPRGWDLIEVKMATKVSDAHLQDVAIQATVLANAGVRVRRAILMHINSAYVRRGAVEPARLFSEEDVTEAIRPFRRRTPEQIRALQKMVAAKKAPAVDIGPQCGAPVPCQFEEHCWKGLAPNSIYHSALSWPKIRLLEAAGVFTIDAIPADFPLTRRQRERIDTAVQRRVAARPSEIATHLRRLSEPLYHLDFETVSSPIPLYDGSRPYEQIPFQFSLRVEEGGRARRRVAYLADPGPDPRPGVAARLAATIGPAGSVVAYNAPFEARVLRGLADAFPAHRKRLTSAADRLWDLIVPFRSGAYTHHAFGDSASLKTVLPVLVPSLTYEDLPIGHGGAASDAYLAMVEGALTGREAERAKKHLLAYCGQDTKAMVEILRVLRRVVQAGRERP